MPSSTGNGGVSARESTSRAVAASSTCPVGIAAFAMPSGRTRTSPSTRTTYSLRRPCACGRSAGSATTCTTPLASRRSTNTTPPWSRREATQPPSATRSPACEGRSVPAPCVRKLPYGFMRARGYRPRTLREVPRGPDARTAAERCEHRDASIVHMREERRTTVRAPTADLATLQAEADRRGVALAAVLSEAVAEKAASLRRRRRPSVGIGRSTDGRSAAEVTAEPVAHDPR